MNTIMNFTEGHKEKREDDYSLYGTKIFNREKKEIGLLIKTWDNGFHSEQGFRYYQFATCVDIKGKRYEVSMADIVPFEDLTDEELKEYDFLK